MYADTFLRTQGWLSLQQVKEVEFSSQRSFLSYLVPIVPGNRDQGKLRQWLSIISDAWEGTNYRQMLPCFLELRAKFNLPASDAETTSHLWLCQPLEHLWKGIVTWKAQIKYKLIKFCTYVLCPHSPLFWSMKPTFTQILNLKCHILIEDFPEHPGWIRNPLEALIPSWALHL